ncbi:hypothetical protein SASPL_155107 [Salvia splendens]|uniref:Uncharacterized protein n=1 Tax=Salvia splendens TaxID=180675 RepID=A0A8X8YZC0_SALSN|nr:hypothetical protein SASPL_155107 [Salvia splendens]
MSTESGKALAEIAAAIKNEAHVQSAKSAGDQLRSVLQNSSLPPKLDLIAAAVGELAREAGFEGLKMTEAAAINRRGIVSPVDDGDHVVVEIQATAD